MFDTMNDKYIKDKIEAFEAEVLCHKKFAEVLDRVCFHLSNPASIEIIVLIGPTGIGKSLMMGHIAKKLNEMRVSQPSDPDYRPVAHTIAMASGYRQFDFKTLYRDALKDLGDPIFDRQGQIDRVYLRSLKLDTTASLRTRMQDEMVARRTSYLLVDEAQHLVFGGKSGSTGDQFDVVKSISQMANCICLMAGPCAMDAELATSSQLARRSVSIIFDRYHADRHEDLVEFGSVVDHLLSCMHLHHKPSTNDILTLLYEGSAGCVGILKDWLTRSYAMAMKSAEDPEHAALSAEILREMRMPAAAMEAVMNDIRRLDDTTKRNASDDAYSEIVRGLVPAPVANSGGTLKPKVPARRSVPVGTRKATRDPLTAPGM